MFYKKVTDYCEKNNISINAFEDMCNLGNGVIGKCKDGSSKPSLTTLERIAKTTKTKVGDWVD